MTDKSEPSPECMECPWYKDNQRGAERDVLDGSFGINFLKIAQNIKDRQQARNHLDDIRENCAGISVELDPPEVKSVCSLLGMTIEQIKV